MKAAEEMRQLKFMEPSDDRNPTQRKDAGNKQKLAINIVLEKKKKKVSNLHSKLSPKETCLYQHMDMQVQGKQQGRSICWCISKV